MTKLDRQIRAFMIAMSLIASILCWVSVNMYLQLQEFERQTNYFNQMLEQRIEEEERKSKEMQTSIDYNRTHVMAFVEVENLKDQFEDAIDWAISVGYLEN